MQISILITETFREDSRRFHNKLSSGKILMATETNLYHSFLEFAEISEKTFSSRASFRSFQTIFSIDEALSFETNSIFAGIK